MEEDRYTRITLRIPRELHSRLDGSASATSKSLNAEIVARLESSYQESAPSAVLTMLAYRMALLEVELQKKRLDSIELAFALKQTLEHVSIEEVKTDPYLQQQFTKYRVLADKFDASQDELEALGREQTEKYEQLKDAARAMHAPRPPLRPAPGFSLPDRADDTLAEPPKRRMNLKRNKIP